MNILNKLTIKHLKMNKKRTVVTIIGVLLSTALMVGIGLLLSSFRNSVIDNIVATNGDEHITFTNVDYNKKDIVLKNENVQETKITNIIGYAYLDGGINPYKPYLKIIKANNDYFNDLEIISGRLPENEDEIVISDHIEENGGVKYHVGDKLVLNIGKRYLDGEYITKSSFYDGETLVDTISKEYTIVGIVKRDIHEDYSDSGYSVFTKGNFKENEKLNILVTYKNPKTAYKISKLIGENLGYADELDMANNLNYNDSLLIMYGASGYGNLNQTFASILIIMLSLVAIGCVVVIYNSFAISVMERKKQFGLFSSIGTTKKQLRKTVFFEAIIIGLIGIPLGIISSYIGIGIVLKIINYLVPDMLGSALKLTTYSLFIIIPVIFMIIVIFLSAFIPSKMASKATPIELIRQNDDIKVKKNKLKSNKLIRRIFGVEGEIAHKNMKRNKKKYRITTASLVISIILFISFSSFMKYAIDSSESYTGVINYDIYLYYDGDDVKKVDELLNNEQIDEFNTIKRYDVYTNTNTDDIMQDDFKKFRSENLGLDTEKNNASNLNIDNASIVVFDNDSYDKYLKKIGEEEIKPILYNRLITTIYSNETRKVYDIEKYNGVKEITLCDSYDYETNKISNCNMKINNYYISNLDFLGYDEYSYSNGMTFIIRESELNKYLSNDMINTNNKYITYIKANKYDKLDEEINKALDNNDVSSLSYYNFTESMKLVNNIVLVVKILVYGFISLVTLIGVTSVFNTINTSIALRRKEFSILRSMGLTPKGFNKIIRFESLFVGLRALLIGLPISFIITVLIHYSMNGIVSYDKILIPWNNIIFAILGVFIIILLTMSYATSKIKKENILDAIREENI